MSLPPNLITNRTARLPGAFRPFQDADVGDRYEIKYEGDKRFAVIRVLVPWPYKELSPNFRSRSHWPKVRATKKYREEAAADARTLHPGNWILFKKATLKPIFHYTAKRGWDDDNLIASLKAARDGTADAGIVVNDHCYTTLPPEFVKDTRRFVELVITGEVP